MKFDLFFPTIISSVEFDKHILIEKELIEHCQQIKQKVLSGGENWISNKTYNTSDGKYEIYHDEKFKLINEWVYENVKIYCDKLGIDSTSLSYNGSWFNVYKKYDYQERHVHPSSTISAIYILTSSNKSARIFFSTPINEMFYFKKKTYSQELAEQISCDPIPGTLIIFPSYLPHAVERHDNDALRISLSYNFKQ